MPKSNRAARDVTFLSLILALLELGSDAKSRQTELLHLPVSVSRTPLPDLLEDLVCDLFLLVGHALVERLKWRDQLANLIGMRRTELCVPAKPVERVHSAALSPFLKQSLHRLSVASHHLGIRLELRFLLSSDVKSLVKV